MVVHRFLYLKQAGLSMPDSEKILVFKQAQKILQNKYPKTASGNLAGCIPSFLNSRRSLLKLLNPKDLNPREREASLFTLYFTLELSYSCHPLITPLFEELSKIIMKNGFMEFANR